VWQQRHALCHTLCPTNTRSGAYTGAEHFGHLHSMIEALRLCLVVMIRTDVGFLVSLLQLEIPNDPFLDPFLADNRVLAPLLLMSSTLYF
jgi:hypothetical protein